MDITKGSSSRQAGSELMHPTKITTNYMQIFSPQVALQIILGKKKYTKYFCSSGCCSQLTTIHAVETITEIQL